MYIEHCVVSPSLGSLLFVFLVSVDHRDLHVLTPSFPTLRSSELAAAAVGLTCDGNAPQAAAFSDFTAPQAQSSQGSSAAISDGSTVAPPQRRRPTGASR